MKNKVIVYLTVAFMMGCASPGHVSKEKSVLIGIGLGAATGAITGNMLSQRNKRKWATNGIFIGAAIGGLGSYMIHNYLEERDEKVKKSVLLNFDKFPASMSKGNGIQDFELSRPEVEKECFDWQVKGKALIQSHCVWRINGHSFWIPSSQKASSKKVPGEEKD